MDISKSQQAQLNKLAKKYQLRLILLFGSYATGKNREKSDIDIAVLTKEDKIDRSFKAFLNLIQDLTTVFQKEADLTILNGANPLLLHQVGTKSKLLFGTKQEFMKFKLYAFHRYNDYLPFFELEEKANKKALQRYVNR